MLVTDSFVYLHQPKTGGTFVADVLSAIHERRGMPLQIVHVEPGGSADLPVVGPGRALRLMLGARNQHGARRDIPAAYRDRTIVATIRNPYDRYISQFEFAWWRVYPEMFGPVEQVRRAYPSYPELSFDQFVQLTNAVSVRPAGGDLDRTPGFHTQQFIEYFFRDPDAAFAGLADEVALRELWAEEMRGLRFLDQGRLNEDLPGFLIERGYSPDEVAFIRGAGRIRPVFDHTNEDGWTKTYSPGLGAYVGRREHLPESSEIRARYYSPALKAYVRRKERLLFGQFPQFDV